jgi:hypothetical protein
MKMLNDKLQRRTLWLNVEERRKLMEMEMKEKFQSYGENSSRRNELLKVLFRTAAVRFPDNIMKREEETGKRRLYRENTVRMISSVEENALTETSYSNQEETFIEWWHNKFEKESKMIKPF